jgi:hypothetical protein
MALIVTFLVVTDGVGVGAGSLLLLQERFKKITAPSRRERFIKFFFIKIIFSGSIINVTAATRLLVHGTITNAPPANRPFSRMYPKASKVEELENITASP